jgi:Cys-tRNA(Pro) deacylase
MSMRNADVCRGKAVSNRLSSGAQRIQDTLDALGFPCQVIEFAHATRSAAEAAEAIGCRLEQIVKSLVFKGKHSGRPILVVVSGSNRVNERRLSQLASESVEKASADFVRQRTGFAVGGVSPVGLREPLETFVDEDLMTLGEVWAAAGTPNAVFQLTPADLVEMTGGRVVAIK